MRRRVLKSGGFTLVELMIVIAIIAILASIAIPQYLKYQRKAKVSSYALPAARACAMDIVSYCAENPGNGSSSIPTQPNCNSPVSTAGGSVSLSDVLDSGCQADGSVSNETKTLVNATLANVNDYYVTCTYENQSVKCTVKGQ